jgi:hypothetical protein
MFICEILQRKELIITVNRINRKLGYSISMGMNDKILGIATNVSKTLGVRFALLNYVSFINILERMSNLGISVALI